MSVYEDVNVSKHEENAEDQISPELLQRFNDYMKAREKEIADDINDIKLAYQRRLAIKKYIQDQIRISNENYQRTMANLEQQVLEVQKKLEEKMLEREKRLEEARLKMEQNKIRKQKMKALQKSDQNTIPKEEVEEKLQHKIALLQVELENGTEKLLELKRKHLELTEQKENVEFSQEIILEENQKLVERKQELEVKLNDLKSKLQGDEVFDNSLAQLDRGPLVGNIQPNDATESLFNEVSNPMEVEEQIYIKNKEEYMTLKKQIDTIKNEYYQLEDEMSKLKSGSLKAQKEKEAFIEFRESSCGEVMNDLISAINIIELNLKKAQGKELTLQDLKTIVKNNPCLEEAEKLKDLMKSRYYLPYKLSKQEIDIKIDIELAEELLKKQIKINQTLKDQIQNLKLSK